MSDVYFPTTSIVSLLYTLQNGASTEIAVVGNEGIVGIAALMGGDSMPNQSVVRPAGRGYRVPAGRLFSELDRAGPAARLLLLYTRALMTQIAQITACNRHHSLDQRLCRFLLFSLDRQATRELSMTQELICHMLGVRREGVTEAAFAMQQAGLIRYQRGHIPVVDRAALEARSCDCYAVIRKEYDRFAPAPSSLRSAVICTRRLLGRTSCLPQTARRSSAALTMSPPRRARRAARRTRARRSPPERLRLASSSKRPKRRAGRRGLSIMPMALRTANPARGAGRE